MEDSTTLQRSDHSARRPRLLRAWLCVAGLAVILCVPSGAAAQSATATNRCVACHSAQTDQRIATPAALFTQPDIHRERGFGCTDCHGANPAADDKALAHDAAQHFKGR